MTITTGTATATVPQTAWEAAGLRRCEITSESWREYVYKDGFVYRVTATRRLYIRKSDAGDSHRAVDADGVVHYIPAGWRVIRWVADPEVEF